MRVLTLALLALPLFAADAPAPKQTDAELLKAANAKIAWLEDRVKASDARGEALSKYFVADEAILKLESAKPPEAAKPAISPATETKK